MNNAPPQFNFRARIALGALFYPIGLFLLVFVPDTGERSEEVVISFILALSSILSCVILIPVILHCPPSQKMAALLLLLIPICVGFYAWSKLGYYFLIEMKYNHPDSFLLKWLKLP